ncbi:hypothetical protein [Streptomyces radicis]|uniref:hypothetical protein n=1 Tax=Streptomyces radicis TaxID=1750517 RepID=UPI0011C402B0|nr:hypothetical protein [Streptomyces radicis]
MANVPRDITDRLRRLETALRELSSAANTAPALDQILDGDVVIGDGGQLRAETPEGRRVFSVGQTPRDDWGVTLARQTGAAALTVGADPSADNAQVIRLVTRDGSTVVADDARADGYLGLPILPIPWQPTPAWQTASKTTGGPVAWYAASVVQSPVFHLITETYAPPRTTAAITLECATGDGFEVWENWTATGGDDGAWAAHTVTRPMTGLPHGTPATWRLRHRVSQGSGRITTHVIGAYQRNTASADEVPAAAASSEENEGEN